MISEQGGGDESSGRVLCFLTGESRIWRSFDYIYDALILAVVFIYLILASQFGSFTHPLAIMLSLPLSLIGGLQSCC